MNTDTDMATLTGAYALDALPEPERIEFERHLADCEDCGREVRELRETATRLGMAAVTTPPDGLEQRVLAEVARTRQDPPRSTGRTDDRSGVTSLRRRPRAAWGVRLAAAAAVLGIAAAGAFGAMAWQAQQELNQAQQQLQRSSDRTVAMSELLKAPDARIIAASAEGMHATTVVSHELDRAMFMSTGIEPPPAGHTYQVWFIGPDGATSAGLIEQDRTGDMSPIMAQMPPRTRAMGVTLEPAGGSPAPTTKPVLTMKMPA